MTQLAGYIPGIGAGRQQSRGIGVANLIRVAILHLGTLADWLPERLADLGIGAPWFARAWIEPDAFALELRNRALVT